MSEAGTVPEGDASAPVASDLHPKHASFRPAGDQVLIRMYGQGLGDCFLLAFPRTSRSPKDPDGPVYVLIDCGVVAGTPDPKLRMQQIVEDIRDSTGGRLDLLVITHEHWDHLSGFLQAEPAWKEIRVERLWTAWTEKDEPSGLPEALRKIREKQRKALEEVADRALRFGLSDSHERTLGLMSFLSDAGSEGLAFGQARGVSDAFALAKGKVHRKLHVCCEPGEIHGLPGTDTVAYVLGPPRSSERLSQLDARSDEPETFEAARDRKPGTAHSRAPEVAARLEPGSEAANPAFGMRRIVDGRSPLNAFAMPLLDPTTRTGAFGASPRSIPRRERDVYERSFPFDRSLRIPLPDAEAAGSEVATVSADDNTRGDSGERPAPEQRGPYQPFGLYYDEVNHWRRIDFDWLGSSGSFALRADNLTNNTSLVLAFELPAPAGGGERKVLLFVGDAQVGNWLSWDEISAWCPVDGASGSHKEPGVEGLLARTAFYKVGHHGSHNATLKKKGVERMGKLETAFVPVSVEVARDLKDWCRMPLDTMLDALAEHTADGVVLSNGNFWPPKSAAALDSVRRAKGISVSDETLPAKQRDGKQVEDRVPLWVQTAIHY